MKRVTVVGSGAWGTALAQVLALNGHRVTVWGRDAAAVAEIRRSACNERYLPGVSLDPGLQWQTDLGRALEGADGAVLVVPSAAFRAVASEMSGFRGPVVSATKGIEYETGLTMTGVARSVIPGARVAAVSGPTIAIEVARGIPAAVVAAAEVAGVAEEVQAWFHRPAFRVYTSGDLLGVELGGALKNVYAIAAGVGDGLGYGDNAKAALVTRAIVEMRRLGEACGADGGTFSGLSGLGDLMVTCFSRQSRNRGFGELLGRGRRPDAIAGETGKLAEGYPTSRSTWRLARRLGVETPIADEVYRMLYEAKEAARAVADLTARESKPEGR